MSKMKEVFMAQREKEMNDQYIEPYPTEPYENIAVATGKDSKGDKIIIESHSITECIAIIQKHNFDLKKFEIFLMKKYI